MLILLFSIASSYVVTDLVLCLDLVKWKLENFKDSFDKILSVTPLDQEKLLDKIIAHMLENCSKSITPEIRSQISSKKNLINLDSLVPLPVDQPQSDSDLELTQSEEQIWLLLQDYALSISNDKLYLYYFGGSFCLVFIIVLYKKIFNTRQKID